MFASMHAHLLVEFTHLALGAKLFRLLCFSGPVGIPVLEGEFIDPFGKERK